jgi:hypothetical protein
VNDGLSSRGDVNPIISSLIESIAFSSRYPRLVFGCWLPLNPCFFSWSRPPVAEHGLSGLRGPRSLAQLGPRLCVGSGRGFLEGGLGW